MTGTVLYWATTTTPFHSPLSSRKRHRNNRKKKGHGNNKNKLRKKERKKRISTSCCKKKGLVSFSSFFARRHLLQLQLLLPAPPSNINATKTTIKIIIKYNSRESSQKELREDNILKCRCSRALLLLLLLGPWLLFCPRPRLAKKNKGQTDAK